MPFQLQAKLLRVLQDGVIEPIGSNRRVPVDVRVISSTNRDLSARIQDGSFREDLFYRLNVFHIHLPPLRQRREDVAPLARAFLDRYARELQRPHLRLAADAVAPLEAHAWPGNVRELQNAMERAAVLATGAEIDARLVRGILPPAAGEANALEPPELQLEPALASYERKLILRALQASGDNKLEAARLLGVSERTLWYKLKRHRL